MIGNLFRANFLLLALALSAPADAQYLVYCKHLQTNEVRIFDGYCPPEWIWIGTVRQ